MKLSIVVPVYNCEATIARTFSSIVNQISNDSELIFVNDGSTDNSLEILDANIKKYSDKNIKTVSQDNKGLLAARKKGFDESKGDFVWTVDGGDCITSNSISIILNEIEKNKDNDIFCFNHILIEDKNIKYHKNYFSSEQVNIKNLLLGTAQSSMCTKVVRRDLIEKCDVYNNTMISLAEDTCQSYNLLSLTGKIKYIDEYLFIYVRDEGSMTKSDSYKNKIKYAIDYLFNSIKSSKQPYINEVEYFAFNQIVVNILLLSKSRSIYKNMIDYYNELHISLNNPYIKHRKLILFAVFIKNRIAINENAFIKLFNRFLNIYQKQNSNIVNGIK